MPTKNFVLALFFTHLMSCGLDNKSEEIKPSDLLGHWKLHETEVVDYIHFLNLKPEPSNMPEGEGLAYEYFVSSDLVFFNDSFSKIDYPSELLFSGNFTIDSSYIRFNNGLPLPVEIIGDTLFLYINNEPDAFLKEIYLRTNFDNSILSILKRDTINYLSLEGSWELLRDYNFDYGYEYTLNFPHQIPDSIYLSKSEILDALNSDKSIEMLTDGKQRKYTIKYYKRELYLIPGKWYVGEDPKIHFHRIN